MGRSNFPKFKLPNYRQDGQRGVVLGAWWTPRRCNACEGDIEALHSRPGGRRGEMGIEAQPHLTRKTRRMGRAKVWHWNIKNMYLIPKILVQIIVSCGVALVRKKSWSLLAIFEGPAQYRGAERRM